MTALWRAVVLLLALVALSVVLGLTVLAAPALMLHDWLKRNPEQR